MLNICFIIGIYNASHYYRAVKAHKQMLEAIWRLYWDKFREWLIQEDYEWRLEHIDATLTDIISEFDDNNYLTESNVRKEKFNVNIQSIVL